MNLLLNHTILIIIITVVVSLLAWQSPPLMQRLIFYPPAVQKGQVDRFVTYGFVHRDGQHLLFNMITLYFFGRVIQEFFINKLGILGFFLFYFSALIAAIVPTYFKQKNNANYSAWGASGAVSAVVFSSILFAPWSWIVVVFVPMPAIVYAIGYIAYSIYADRYKNDSIAHSAHLVGAIYGWLITILIEPKIISYFINQLMHPRFLGF